MESHHDDDETKGSVYFFVQDYIEAREASGSVRTAGPKDLTVTVHWPNSKPWSESQSQGPPPLPNPELEESSQSKVLPHRIRRRRPVEGVGGRRRGMVWRRRRCGGEVGGEAAKVVERWRRSGSESARGVVAGVKKRHDGIL